MAGIVPPTTDGRKEYWSTPALSVETTGGSSAMTALHTLTFNDRPPTALLRHDAGRHGDRPEVIAGLLRTASTIVSPRFHRRTCIVSGAFCAARSETQRRPTTIP